MQKMLRIAALSVLVPAAAFAADIPPPKTDWHRCATDKECVLVQGICGKAAVNWAWKDEATKYYAQEAAKTNCAAQFWRAEPHGARCRLEACELALESAKE